MDTSKEKKFVCRFCGKEFRSGKSLGGHIRIHTNENSIDSDTKRLREKNPKRLAPKQRTCYKEFQERIVIGSESDTETTSSSPIRKRSKRVMKQDSDSFSDGCSSEIDQDHKNMAMTLMKLFKEDSGLKSSLADSSDNNSVNLETKELNMFNGETNQLLVTVDEQVRSGDDDDDSDTSASDYFTNGPKKSDSDISIDRNTATGNNKLGSKHELRKSKSVFVPSYETDSCADTNIKIRSKSVMVNKKSKKESKSHECPICFRVFKSGQALGGHKRSHFIGNHEQVARDPIDLNLPAPEFDE